MFNKELKKQISDLEKKLSDANTKIKQRDIEIKFLKFQIENPPKYEEGDKIGDLMVIGRKLNKPELIDIITELAAITFTAIFLGRRKSDVLEKLTKDFSKNHTIQWEYKLINTTTGERLVKKELELQILSK